MDPKTNALLVDLQAHLLSESIGSGFTGGVVSPGLAEDIDAVDEYLAETVRVLMQVLELDEETASDYVLWAAQSGELIAEAPTLPEMTATVEEIEAWLKAVETAGFAERVCESAALELEQAVIEGADDYKTAAAHAADATKAAVDASRHDHTKAKNAQMARNVVWDKYAKHTIARDAHAAAAGKAPSIADQQAHQQAHLGHHNDAQAYHQILQKM